MIPILLAAGHGGADSGAVSPDGKHNERDEAIIIVDRIAAALTALGIKNIVAPHGHDTHQTIPWVNARYNYGDVWALEIHRDSADTIKEPAASLRCGIYHGSSSLSTQVAGRWLAAAKQAGADASSWARNQNTSRHGRLGWIAQPEALSHLLELGFMEGRHDDAHLANLAQIATAAIIAGASAIP